MKIKIRPDESGTPGTPGNSEWAAMHDWLADLREDGEGQAMPESENFTGPDHEGYAEPDRGRHQGTSSEGYAEPDRDRYAETGREGYAGPDRETYTEPDRDRYVETGRQTHAEPGRRSYAEPDGDRYVEAGRDRFTGTDRQSYTEPDRQSHQGTSSEGYATAHSEGHGGPANGGYAQQTHERQPRPMAPAPAPGPGPAPRHGYMSRTRAGTRTRTGPPTEAAAVRAIIGDELRTPTVWCEMGGCISCHADRSALGEADVRARAIGAGWRIDSLGRLACPRCVQTSATFRATRPVVPWDRATAISMAARATARGNRTAGPAGANGSGTQHQASPGTQRRANGHGTRQPSHGRR